jgi:hypothetical protein
MNIYEFLERKRAAVLQFVIPKGDLKSLRRIAIRERQDGAGPIARAAIRAFLFEARRLEAAGKTLPVEWLSHTVSDASKMVLLKVVMPEEEAAELDRIIVRENAIGEGIKHTKSSICRSILRAFIVAEERAVATSRPVDTADIFSASA